MTGQDYSGVESSLTNMTSRSSFFYRYKEQYLPKLNDWINQGFGGKHVIAEDLMDKRGGMIGGQKLVGSVSTNSPQSVQFGGEGHILPTASSSRGQNPVIISRTLRYRLAFTEESQTSARAGNSVAWAAPKADELRMAREQLETNVARNLHHGRYNVLGSLSSVGSASNATWTLNGINERRSTAAAFYTLGAKHIRRDMDVQIVRLSAGLGGIPAYNQSTTGALRIRVSNDPSSDETNPTMTVVDSAGAAVDVTGATMLNGAVVDGDLIIPFDSRRHSGVTYSADASSIGHFFSMNGAVDFFKSSTITPYTMGLVKANVTGIQPQDLANAGTQRAFQEGLVHLLSRRIREKVGETVDTLLHADSLFWEIAKENTPNKRFESVLGKSGFKNLAWVDNAVTLKYQEDWLCLPGLIWAYDSSLSGYFEQKPLSPPPGYGEEHAVQDYANSEIVATKMGNCMYKRPELSGCLDDLIFDHWNMTA